MIFIYIAKKNKSRSHRATCTLLISFGNSAYNKSRSHRATCTLLIPFGNSTYNKKSCCTTSL